MEFVVNDIAQALPSSSFPILDEKNVGFQQPPSSDDDQGDYEVFDDQYAEECTFHPPS